MVSHLLPIVKFMYSSMRTIVISILLLFSTVQASVSGDLDLPPALQHGRIHHGSSIPLEGEFSRNTPHSSVIPLPGNENLPSSLFPLRAQQDFTSLGPAYPLGRVVDLGKVVSLHVQVINKKGIPVAQPVPVPVERNVPVAVPQPIDVPVDRPYPVHVPVKVPWKVYKDVPYPVDTPVYIPVDKVHSKIHVHVPHKIYHHKPVPFKVWKKVPVPVPDPVVVAKPVPVAIRTYFETLSQEDLHHYHHHNHNGYIHHHKPSW